MEGQAPEVAARLLALFGTSSLPERGVVHITAVARTEDGALRVLAIGPKAPPSATDFFLLNLARARADAILTTGSIVRAEPELTVGIAGPDAEALTRYRHEVLGKPAPAWCAIMTRDGRLPRLHPLWGDGTRKLVLTEPANLDALERELDGRAEVLAVDDLNARVAVELLEQRGAALVSIEAGPRANAALYEPLALVDELLLSLYEGPLEGVELGGALTPRLLEGLRCASDVSHDEQSGRWRFQRWLR